MYSVIRLYHRKEYLHSCLFSYAARSEVFGLQEVLRQSGLLAFLRQPGLPICLYPLRQPGLLRQFGRCCSCRPGESHPWHGRLVSMVLRWPESRRLLARAAEILWEASWTFRIPDTLTQVWMTENGSKTPGFFLLSLNTKVDRENHDWVDGWTVDKSNWMTHRFHCCWYFEILVLRMRLETNLTQNLLNLLHRFHFHRYFDLSCALS